MTIPASTRRAHFDPYWFGDSLWAIDRAHKRHYKYIDQNGLAIWSKRLNRYVMAVAHWPIPRKEGYRWIAEVDAHRNYRHDSKGREVRVRWSSRRSVHEIDWDEYRRLRLTKRQGWTKRSQKRPTTLDQNLIHAKSKGIIITWELKAQPGGPDPFLLPAVAIEAQKYAAKAGWKPYIMTLQTLGNGFGRLKNFHDHGFETAVLPRSKKPADWTTNESRYVDAVWGRWRRR